MQLKHADLENRDLKRNNKLTILQLLYREQQKTRKDIADRVGLSLPTVTQLLVELEKDGLVETVGQKASTGGRRAVLNAIVSDARASVGVSISMHWVRIVLMNMGPTVVDQMEYQMLFSDTPEYWLKISHHVDAMIERNKIVKSTMLGIGMSFPGILSNYGSSIEFIPTLGVDYIELSHIRRFFNYPITFGNDASLAARAESWFRPSIDKAVYLLISRGVGGAFIGDDGRFFGARAGEFGHMIIQEGGKLCSCGRRGCLETYCSSASLVAEAGIYDIDKIVEGATSGDEKFSTVWKNYIDHLVTGLLNIRSIFDVDIIIGGEMAKNLELFSDQLRKAIIEKSNIAEDGRFLHFSNYGKYDSAIGAALLNVDIFLNKA